MNIQKIVISSFLLLFGLQLEAQEDSLLNSVTRFTYYIDSTLITQIDFELVNNTTNTYVLWIEKEYNNTRNKTEKINKYFFTRKGDFSLMELIWDGNVESYTPELFISFFKIIYPSEDFTISFKNSGTINNYNEKMNSLKNHIVIVNTSEIRNFDPNSSLLKKFDRQINNISIEVKSLKDSN